MTPATVRSERTEATTAAAGRPQRSVQPGGWFDPQDSKKRKNRSLRTNRRELGPNLAPLPHCGFSDQATANDAQDSTRQRLGFGSRSDIERHCPQKRYFPSLPASQGPGSSLVSRPRKTAAREITPQKLPVLLAAFRTDLSPSVAEQTYRNTVLLRAKLPRESRLLPMLAAALRPRSWTEPKPVSSEAVSARDAAKQVHADLAAMARNAARELDAAAAKAHQETIRIAKERQAILNAGTEPIPPSAEETSKLADSAEKLAKL